MKATLSLNDLLDEISVHSDRDAAVEAGNTSWPEGWFAVSGPSSGIIAYFQHEIDACRFRMDWINRLLNPTEMQEMQAPIKRSPGKRLTRAAMRAALKKLVGQKIHAFGPDSHGIWGSHDEVQTHTIQNVSYEDDYLLVYLVNYDPNVTGLIYTCRVFQKELRAMLRKAGITAEISYSEQGMQGDNYVHFDIG